MSKNLKGRSDIKLRSKGHGRRNYKRSLHIITCGGGDSFNWLNNLSFHTPAIFVMEKRGQKMVKVAQYIKEDREARLGMIQRLKDYEMGKIHIEGHSQGEIEEKRKYLMDRLRKDIERPGTVSQRWQGSNRHDRGRDDVQTKQESASV